MTNKDIKQILLPRADKFDFITKKRLGKAFNGNSKAKSPDDEEKR